MKKENICNNYAEALYLSVEDKENVLNKLETVSRVLKQFKKAESVLIHPYISKDKKIELIKKLTGSNLSTEFENFLGILIDYRRINLIGLISKKFRRMYEEQLGIMTVEITSSSELRKEDVNKIAEIFSKKTGKRIKTETKTDKTLIAGIEIRSGEKVYTKTLRNMLDDFKSRIIREAA